MSSKVENQKRKILAVDDDPASLTIIKKALQWEGYQVETADSGATALRKIADWQPHLVLLDVNMPGLNGLETLRFLRGNGEYVSAIFISGKSDDEDIIRGLDSGADDYICKPFEPSVMLSRVRCQLRIKDIRDELRQANRRLQELVEIDDLTGLYNMRSLYEKVDHELQRAARYKRAVAAIMMDMDHFKTVNDDHDHLFGSYVLSQVGLLIRESIRKIDFGARYGGDEFLIILTETHLEGVRKFCERLRASVEREEFKHEGHEMKLTASIGFAATAPGQGNIDARSLIRLADRALYDAKEQGRNRVVGFDLEKDFPVQEPRTIPLRRKTR